MYIFTGSEKLLRIVWGAFYSYTEFPSWTGNIKTSYFLKTLCEMLAVLPQTLF